MSEPSVARGARVAVLLAAYNGLRWLPAQLASILDQREVEVTVFASVDQSHDGTEAWLRERERADARIVVLPAGRFGGAAANFFRLLRDVDLASFDFVALSDQDDLWLPDKLARAIDALTREKAAGYSANVVAFWEDGKTALIDKAQPQTALDFVFEAAGPGCTYVLNHPLASALQSFVSARVRELDAVYLHDWLIYAFARAQGFAWFIDPAPCLRYRQHASNQVGVNKGLQALLRRAGMAGSGWAFAQAAMIARLVGADRLPPISAWLGGGRIGLVGLSLRAHHCRRKPKDRVLFFLACWLRALNPFAAFDRSPGT